MSISNLSPASQPVRKQRRPAIIDLVQSVPTDLGECISRDVKLLDKLGWHGLVAHRRPTGDFSSLTNVNHPARRLLKLYKYRGAPVKFATPPWTRQQILRALHRGPHKSCHDHISFLQGEFKDMMSRGQWLVLPYSAVKDLPGLRLSPPGVVPQRNRRPRWICDYSWWGINADTLPLAAKESMQCDIFGRYEISLSLDPKVMTQDCFRRWFFRRYLRRFRRSEFAAVDNSVT